jgi:biopolymer transport protein ExbB/TolQ
VKPAGTFSRARASNLAAPNESQTLITNQLKNARAFRRRMTMRRKTIPCFILLSLFVLLTIAEATACVVSPLKNNARQQGGLAARDTNGVSLGSCEHQLTHVKIINSNLFSRIMITEIFKNILKEKISASYSLPLPEDAAIESILVYAGEQIIKSDFYVNKETEQFSEYIDDSQEIASRLNENRPNQFTQSIPHIAPGEEIELVIIYRDKAYESPQVFHTTAFRAEAGEEDINLAGVYRKMNPYILLIGLTLFCMSIYLLGAIIRRFIIYYSAGSQSRYFVSRITQVLRLNRWQEAINISQFYTQSPVAKIMTEVFHTLEANPHANETLPELCGSARSRAITKSDAELRKGLRNLKTAGWLAIMLGFLGTVISLLDLFQGAIYAEAVGLSAVAGGISDSFMIALFGLMIAVPAIWAHKYFSTKATKIGLEADKSSWELLDCLLKKRCQENALNQMQSTIYSDCYS